MVVDYTIFTFKFEHFGSTLYLITNPQIKDPKSNLCDMPLEA